MFSIFSRQRPAQDIIMCRRMIIVIQEIMLELKKDERFIPTDTDIDALEHLSELTHRLYGLINYTTRYTARRRKG